MSHPALPPHLVLRGLVGGEPLASPPDAGDQGAPPGGLGEEESVFSTSFPKIC